MIGSIVRSVAAVVAGLVVAMILVVLVEFGSSIVHPFPPGFDPNDFEACKAHVARYPGWVLAVVVAAWGLTTFLGSWVAARLGTGRHRAHGIVVGLILLGLAIMNMSMLPYPIWFWVGNLVAFPLGFYFGSRLGGPRPSTGGGPAADSIGLAPL